MSFTENCNELFVSDLNSYSVQLLKDIFIELNKQNDCQIQQIKANVINLDKFKSTDGVVQNIITICELLNQNDCVKYAAIELFDKLLVKLVCDTRRVFFQSVPFESFDWTRVESKISKQMHLRVITCVGIASKVYNKCGDSVKMSQMKRLLQTSGYKYSLKNLNNSEIRVLKLFNYKLSITSIDIYVETLLSILKHNIGNTITTFATKIGSFYTTAKQLTDLYYMCRTIVNRNVYKIMSKGLRPVEDIEELEIQRIAANKMLISCGIIASIPILIDVSINEYVINELSDITNIPRNHIIDMSHALLLLVYD